MSVKLMHRTPLSVATHAARVCTATEEKGCVSTPDSRLLQTLARKGHESVLEHIVLTFLIEGKSRRCLQELVRHRIASYSVQSTRWSLKKLANRMTPDQDVDDYLVRTGDGHFDYLNRMHLLRVVWLLRNGQVKNDTAKMMLPEAFKTKTVVTINLRSFRNFLNLRTAQDAHWEIRNLAQDMFLELPEELVDLTYDVFHVKSPIREE